MYTLFDSYKNKKKNKKIQFRFLKTCSTPFYQGIRPHSSPGCLNVLFSSNSNNAVELMSYEKQSRGSAAE